MERREKEEEKREVWPLRKADDAVVINTSGLTVEGGVALIKKERQGAV